MLKRSLISVLGSVLAVPVLVILFTVLLNEPLRPDPRAVSPTDPPSGLPVLAVWREGSATVCRAYLFRELEERRGRMEGLSFAPFTDHEERVCRESFASFRSAGAWPGEDDGPAAQVPIARFSVAPGEGDVREVWVKYGVDDDAPNDAWYTVPPGRAELVDPTYLRYSGAGHGFTLLIASLALAVITYVAGAVWWILDARKPSASPPTTPSSAVLLTAGLLVTGGCAPDVERGAVQVLARHPHDPEAYTQGLLFHDGRLYESTGRYGSSDVREVELATGRVLREVELPAAYFGEGLARVEDRLVQLTWKEGVAFVWDLESLAVRDTLELDTNGWGLCFDGEWLHSTSGGSILFVRDPGTLETRRTVQVTVGGTPRSGLNELECVGEHVYANVYQSNEILKIRKDTGEVVAVFDAGALVPDEVRGSAEAVLNGIAWNPESGTFYVTGKLWPVLYEVSLASPLLAVH